MRLMDDQRTHPDALRYDSSYFCTQLLTWLVLLYVTSKLHCRYGTQSVQMVFVRSSYVTPQSAT